MNAKILFVIIRDFKFGLVNHEQIGQTLIPSARHSLYMLHTLINNFYRKTFKIDDEFSLLGNSHIINLTDTERELFIQAGFNNPPTTASTYSAFLILKTKRIIQAAPTSRSKKRDNSCLSFTSGFGILQKIILIENPIPNCLIIVTKLQSASSQLCTDDITHSQFNQHFKCFIPPRYKLACRILCLILCNNICI